MRSLLVAMAIVGLGACSLVTVKQDPFPALQVTATPPPKKPPRVVLTDSAIKIADKVMFETGKATLLEASNGLLDDVAKMMVDNPQIEVLQVEGHTDATGGAATNKKLSRARAESVRDYLVGRGVDNKRLVAKGFGPDKPIADNETEEGREANRRVEFNIIKQGKKKTLVEDE